MDPQKVLNKRRQRRRFHVRKSVRRGAERPRLSVCRTLKHISCQVIDDTTGRTLVSAGTQDKQIRGQIKYGGNKAAAAVVGQAIAQRALAAGIQLVRFDRGSARYHGRVAALAEAAREAGLTF